MSATCWRNWSMPFEQPLSDSTASAAAEIRMGLVIGDAASVLAVVSGARRLASAGRPLRLSRGRFFLVQVTVRLRRQVELQLIAAGTLADLRNFDVVQRHDARQRGDAADERADRMEAAGQTHLDRQLGVEVLDDLRARLEQLLIEAGGRA